MPKYHYRQSLRDRGICVIIPTYNNGGTIADVVERALLQCADVIVVNDGSTDDTARILSGIDGIDIITLDRNQGKGSALKHGFKHAIKRGFDYAITLDGDGQHYPEDIEVFYKANLQYPGCLIVGARRLDGVQRSRQSSFANSFSNFWFSVQTFHRLPDTQTGYRLYPLHHLYGLQLLTSRYEAELELLVLASWHGVKLVSRPVNVYYPNPCDRVSHFRPIRDFARISVLNTMLCFLAIIYGLPCFLLRALRTMLFTLTTYLVYIAGATVITPIALGKHIYSKITHKNTSALHRIIHFFSRLTVKALGLFGAKVKVDNPGGETFRKPAIIICNHQSQLDIIVQLNLVKKVVFLTNDWVWNNPVIGGIVRCAEYYPVSLGLDELMPRLKALVERGYSISIFPEGTRSGDGSIERFHKGVFLIASQLNLDILPMVLYGTGRVMPKHGWTIHRWPIELGVYPRIAPSMMTQYGDTLRLQAQNMRHRYQEIYNEMKNQIERNV